MSQPAGFSDKVRIIWRIADTLRGHFWPHEYGQIVLPLLVIRRLNAVLEAAKPAVLKKAAALEASGKSPVGADKVLRHTSENPFHNTSPMCFSDLVADDKNVNDNFLACLVADLPVATEAFDAYDLPAKLKKMNTAKALYPVVADFADLDLHPDRVSNEAMGYTFEQLLRRFSEMSNETHGGASIVCTSPLTVEMPFTKGKPVSLKSHPSYSERWPQNLIAADRGLLGLGTLLRRRVVAQPSAVLHLARGGVPRTWVAYVDPRSISEGRSRLRRLSAPHPLVA